MLEKINVLIFPAGEINSVELHAALSTCVNINVIGASSIERHGRFIFENYIKNFPNITDKNFIAELNELIEKHNIDIIFPTHDSVSLFFSEHKAEINSEVIGANPQTADICRHKHKTYNLFKHTNFIPHIYHNPNDIKEYPVFIKLDTGQGSVGAKTVYAKEELNKINFKEYVISEYLPGKELTVDCFTGKNNELQYISPRSRDRIMAGVSVAGSTIKVTEEIQNIAQQINSRLNFLGLWYFQIKQDIYGNYKLLEISTRCSGTMCLTRAKGINLPLLSVYAQMGYEITVFDNQYNVTMDRTLIGRFEIDYDYNTVYFDLDDTLIINQKVNLNAIRFLYQCKNKGINVFLLSKHEGDIEQTLERFSISPSLFLSILHINPEENKYLYITEKRAIFIDNSFNERKIVKEKLEIPVFDVDSIEFLLDWRI